MGAAGEYTHYGWTVSPYTQKTLAYLRHKGIPHRAIAPSILQLNGKIARHIGRMVMPTVETPDGQWWQDSSDIVDHFERRFPQPSIHPVTPKQRITSYLLELHADDWLIMAALHYRWNVAESSTFAIREFGRNALPWMPGFVQHIVGRRIAAKMQAHMPRYGLDGDVLSGLQRYTENLLRQLDVHFKHHNFLLGSQACLGDFALFGPLWAHLYRDGGSSHLFTDKPAVVSWMNRLLEAPTAVSEDGVERQFLAYDEIPDSLNEIMKVFFSEHFEFVKSVIAAVEHYAQAHPGSEHISSIVGYRTYRIGGVTAKRMQNPITQWKAQRALDVYHSLNKDEKTSVDIWLQEVGGESLQHTRIVHRLRREGYREVLCRSA